MHSSVEQIAKSAESIGQRINYLRAILALELLIKLCRRRGAPLNPFVLAGLLLLTDGFALLGAHRMLARLLKCQPVSRSPASSTIIGCRGECQQSGLPRFRAPFPRALGRRTCRRWLSARGRMQGNAVWFTSRNRLHMDRIR